jgi:hypothetical protein
VYILNQYLFKDNAMKKIMMLLFSLLAFSTISINAEGIYPFVYIPGMFDNGDFETPDSLLVQQCTAFGGFYDLNYFTDDFSYDKGPIHCSSTIVGSKYQRLSVVNTIGTYRTNIPLWLMGDRFFCLMQGKAPGLKSWRRLTNYEGNDYEGIINMDGNEIHFRGLIEEIWARYGKTVNFVRTKNGLRVTLESSSDGAYAGSYSNPDGYFTKPDEIGFNLVVHSSGGIALRRYIQLCEKEGLNHHVKSIVNLSVPQQGASMKYALKRAFPKLIRQAMNKFEASIENGSITVASSTGAERTYTYSELAKMTRINMMYGDKAGAKLLRKIVGDYILYHIPFDGHKRVLGTDPALWDLDPRHRLIKMLGRVPLPEDIPIYNYKVLRAYAPMFVEVGKFLELGKNDGVVDYRDTGLDHLPNFNNLDITNYEVERANHIPFPYIEPLYELHDTVDQFYGFLKILVKEKMNRDEGVFVVHALLKAIIVEFGLDLEYFLENEDFSVIDYFAENPVDFNE